MAKKYTHIDFEQKVFAKYGDLFVFLEQYQNSTTKILTKCKFGHEFLADPKKLTKTNGYKGCPICNHGETKEQYDQNPKYCRECGEKILFTDSASVTRKKIFCNQSCAAKFNNKNRISTKKPKYCITCGKELTTSAKKYCSSECQFTNQYNQYIEQWKNGFKTGLSGEYGISNHIKNYLFKKYDNKCARCGWSEINPFTNKIPLEVEHIDGNYLNNNEDNLILLCPNCHSLTATYKGANVGKGREGRKKYY